MAKGDRKWGPHQKGEERLAGFYKESRSEVMSACLWHGQGSLWGNLRKRTR